jgi:hypothetical protein
MLFYMMITTFCAAFLFCLFCNTSRRHITHTHPTHPSRAVQNARSRGSVRARANLTRVNLAR